MTNAARLALLVDADNAQSTRIADVLKEMDRHGSAIVRRAYGDWTTPNLGGWKKILQEHAIQPIQQFPCVSGKNATDAALIIDAMDLLHTGALDGFCLVSSDSDFTRLATRIRESGRTVIGFGERKTPSAFVNACDRFVFVEILGPASSVIASSDAGAPDLEPLLRHAIGTAAREDGWSSLSLTGQLLVKATPSFDARNYGFEKLGELVRAQPYVDVREVPTAPGASTAHLFVRLKSTMTKPSATKRRVPAPA
ncbi:MAG TPA: NYN domain-containing protein [Lysobacter sp.]|nr:NYN domain-containing protein [Lysobacter sp.]